MSSEQCPQLLAKIQERNSKPSSSVQLIAVEPRPIPAVNVVTRSGATTEAQCQAKQPDEAWVHKAVEKTPAFDVRREKETFLEARQDFVDSDLPAPNKQHQQLQSQEDSQGQVSTLSLFLQSCIKLLRNQNALNELQKVIQSCEPHQSPDSERAVSRVRRTGREMRLHAQVGEYDMKDIILDLGSEVNILTKQTWEQMGKPTLDWSPI